MAKSPAEQEVSPEPEIWPTNVEQGADGRFVVSIEVSKEGAARLAGEMARVRIGPHDHWTRMPVVGSRLRFVLEQSELDALFSSSWRKPWEERVVVTPLAGTPLSGRIELPKDAQRSFDSDWL